MAETTRQRMGFDAYVKLGPGRSLEALRERMAEDPMAYGVRRAPNLRTLWEWSRRFGWQDRLVALEREAAARDREDQALLLREMNTRHAKEGVALQQKGVEGLAKIPPDEWPPSACIVAIERGIEIERSARGHSLPAEEVSDERPLRSLSLVELRRLVEIAASGAGGARGADGNAGGLG